MEVTIIIPAACIAHCKKLGVQDATIQNLVHTYINEQLGTSTYYGDVDHFSNSFIEWTQNSDDAADILLEDDCNCGGSKDGEVVPDVNLNDESFKLEESELDNLTEDDFRPGGLSFREYLLGLSKFEEDYDGKGDDEAQDFDTFGEHKI